MIGDYFCDDEVADGKGTYLQRNNGNMVLVFPWMIKLLMERALTWNVTMATWSLSSHEVENVEANSRWHMPRKGMVKINVHGCFFDNPLPNGNVSGIGAVIRNSREPFGRVFELWSHDMGLGSTEPRYMAVHEADIELVVLNGEEAPVAEVEDEEASVDANGDRVEVIEYMD
ncbi:hypothetical protein ACET3Z_001460 [Daucus carota]